jgi:integrase
MSIRKRGHNYWEICIQEGLDPQTGKNLRTYHSFRGTEREAQQENTRPQYARDNGVPLKPSKLTLVEYLEQWLNDYARLHVSPRTLQGYRTHVTLHIAPRLGKIPLSKPRPAQIQAFYSERLDHGRLRPKPVKEEDQEPGREQKQETGLSHQTVLHFHHVLHEALKTAVKWGLLPVNPADAVSPPKVTRQDPHVLTGEQTAALLRAAEGKAIYAPVVLAVGSGLRRGELLALRWSDGDLDSGTMTSRRTLSETKAAGLPFKEPKTRTSRRTLTLPAFAREALSQHKEAQDAHRDRLGNAYKDEELVFPAEDGQPWAPNLLTGAFRRFVDKQDLPRVRFHDLRHGHITSCYSAASPSKW